MRRLLIALLGAAVLVGGAVAYLRFAPLRLEVARVESDVPIEVFGLGTVEARVLSRVGFEVGGTLAALAADHGDLVAAGAELARLDSAAQEARLEKAEAGVEQARAALARARAGVQRAEALVGQRRQVSTRRQELRARGAVSIEAAEDALAELAVAEAELALARSDVAVAQAGLADAEAAARAEAVRLAQHRLLAPYDALVVARHREPGDVAVPGEPVFTLVDPTTFWALAHVDEAVAGGIAVGQPAEVRLRSLPGELFRGRVARIAIESDRVTEERSVYIKCEICPPEPHLGEQAEVLITKGRLERALLVPEAAIALADPVRGTVWTIEDGRLARREVGLGARTLDGRMAVVEGLPDGALVVGRIEPGMVEGRRAVPLERAP
jgi:HlyD family secretion protein